MNPSATIQSFLMAQDGSVAYVARMSEQAISVLDLNTATPRSPRTTLAGHVIFARTLDKCRSVIAGTAGEYHFDCPLDQLFLSFVGLTADAFKAKVATGATDEAMAAWVQDEGTAHGQEEIVAWNNDLRYKRINEMPIELQVFLEGYIPQNIPEGRVVNYWFDVYDIEEGRL